MCGDVGASYFVTSHAARRAFGVAGIVPDLTTIVGAMLETGDSSSTTTTQAAAAAAIAAASDPPEARIISAASYPSALLIWPMALMPSVYALTVPEPLARKRAMGHGPLWTGRARVDSSCGRLCL